MKEIISNNFIKLAKISKKDITPTNPFAVCVVPETYITLRDGISVPIKDIKIGDEVYTHKGRLKRVKDIMKRNISEDIYKIYVSGIPDPLCLTGEHPILSVSSNKKFSGYAKDKNGNKNGKKWYKYEYSSELDFIPACCLNDSYAIHSPTLIVERDDVYNFNKYDAFIMGVYCAEGYIAGKLSPKQEWKCGKNYNILKKRKDSDKGCYVGFTLNKDKDIVLLNFIKKYAIDNFGPNSYIIRGPYKYNPKVINIFINSRKFSKFIIQHVGKGASNKKLSNAIMSSSVSIIPYFVLGYLMGDGSFDIHYLQQQKNKYSKFMTNGSGEAVATSASKNLIHQLFWLLDRCGISSSLFRNFQNRGPNNRNIKYKGYGIRINSKELSKINFAINDFNVFDKYIEINSKGKRGQRFLMAACSFGKIRKIEKFYYNGDVYNLEVEDDNSYIANLCSVHNCNSTVGKKKNPKKFEKCVKSIKKQNRKTAQIMDSVSSNNINQVIKSKINSEISSLSNYFKGINDYLTRIKNIMSKYGIYLSQEDGTDFEGIFTGEKGRARIDLKDKNGIINNSYFIMEWYKMPESLNYEINGYLS